MTNYYGDNVIYGSGKFYGATTTVSIPVTPQQLRFYRTSQDGVYVFYWTFSASDISQTLFSFDYELQLDTVPTFDSPDLVSFLSADVITYQNGNVWKGYAVPVASRLEGVEQTWYAQVRVVSGSNIGDWSAPLTWTIPRRWQQQTAEELMAYLPDYHVYGKEDLLKPVDQRNTNLYLVENMYAEQFDSIYYENFLTQTDNFISLVRDEFLYSNFGVLFNYVKPNSQQFVEYRETIRQLILGSLAGSTPTPIIGVIQSFTGVPPLIVNIRDLNDFFLNLIKELPLDAPDGIRTEFHVTYQFVTGTMQIFQNGTLLSPGTDFTEDEALPGFVMTIPPAPGDVLDVFYQIGLPGDPRPILFDPTATTPLTGNVTYTNGSLTVTGSGTLFMAEVSVGDVLVDTTSGYYMEVFQVVSNTSIKLVTEWGGPTETVPAEKAQYGIDPIVLWDRSTLSFGVVIIVRNPAGFLIDLDLIEFLVNPLLPAQLKVFYQVTF